MRVDILELIVYTFTLFQFVFHNKQQFFVIPVLISLASMVALSFVGFCD